MGRKLYVGNLGFDVTNQELQDAFAAGRHLRIRRGHHRAGHRRSRGFAFVEMSSDADAQKAIQELDGREIKGRAIRVSQAKKAAAVAAAVAAAGGGAAVTAAAVGRRP